MMSQNPIILTAGGTGGHIFPSIAVAEELLYRGHTIFFVTDARGLKLSKTSEKILVKSIGASHIHGNIQLKLKGVFSIAVGLLQAFRIIAQQKPCCVAGFGGYASFPMMFAATLFGLPTLIHEQNAVMGRTNRAFSKKATFIATSFKETSGTDIRNKSKTIVTGNPVRAEFSRIRNNPYPSVRSARQSFRVLILGGSQGTSIFGKVVPKALTTLPARLRQRFSVVQQCRAEDIEKIRSIYLDAGITAELSTFFENVHEHVENSHVIISRSGASTVAELTEAGRPAILVPYPYSTDNHQIGNARQFAETGAGWMISNDSFTEENLVKHIRHLIDEPKRLADAANAARELGGKHSTQGLCDLIETVIKRKKSVGKVMN